MTGGEGSTSATDNTQELAELFDATLKFTSVLKKKGVSQSTLMVGKNCPLQAPLHNDCCTKAASALQVAVRCRPLTRKERSLGCQLITRLVEDKVVSTNRLCSFCASTARESSPRFLYKHGLDGILVPPTTSLREAARTLFKGCLCYLPSYNTLCTVTCLLLPYT